MEKKSRRGARMEFTAQLQKREKYTLWVRIPEEVMGSLGLKEGDFVKVALKPVEKEGEQPAPTKREKREEELE